MEEPKDQTPLVDATTDNALDQKNSSPSQKNEANSSSDTVNSEKIPQGIKPNKIKLLFAILLSHINIYFLSFLIVILIAFGVIVVALINAKKDEKKSALKTVVSQPLKQEDLDKLKSNETKIGDLRQLLSVEANAAFSGTVLIRGGLDVAGPIKVGGALNLPGITVSGTSSFDEVNINHLAITGDTSVQGSLNVKKNIVGNGDINVGGTISANRFNIKNLEVTGDLSFNKHIDAGGPSPSIVTGGAVGSGGTVSISGTDTAGTVTVNVGSNPPGGGGTLASITFSTAFNQAPHVVITPVGSNGAALNYYVTRTPTGFVIAITNGAASNQSFSFDYIAID